MTPPLPVSPWLGADPRALDDDTLLTGARELGELKRFVEAGLASFAAEIKHRSRPEAGFTGLAQRLGARTPENLVQEVAGTSKREAGAMVRVGELLTVDAAPWLSPVGDRLASGAVSVEKADAIRAGLGTPTAEVASDDLLDAAAELAALAPTLPVEKLAVRAREFRDELDAANVRDRHRALRDQRSLYRTRQSNGMTRVVAMLDPDSDAIISAAFDAATAPRRGGPRFVDPEAVEAAERLVRDERTTEQIALDTFVDLVRIGAEADPNRLLGTRRHAVQVLVTDRDLRTHTGASFYRDLDGAQPVETAERIACDAGTQHIVFDQTGDRPLDVGRTQRLFTAKQRIALAARDGGCRFAGCDRPVSWCEAHHITLYSRGGRTDIDDGILLCRHHHMLVHDNGWRVEKDAAHGFVLIPPRSRDPRQVPIPIPPRSKVATRLRSASTPHPQRPNALR